MLKHFFGAQAKFVQIGSIRNRSFRMLKIRMERENLVPFSDDDYAYNHVEKKDSRLKPHHTVEEQIEYMNSEAYHNIYKGRPIWEMWKRNLRGQIKLQPPARLFCIDRNGRFNVNHACPVCRDEYLFFDYRNVALIDQFLRHGTDVPLPILRTGLCQEQHINLRAQVQKAKDHGTMPFNVEFRHFDYNEWYPGLWNGEQTNIDELPKRVIDVDDVYPNPDVDFPAHNRDINTNWDEWWVRHEKFARKAR